MNESFLHFIWRHGLHYPLMLNYAHGDKVEVISRGKLNSNAGPDFFNAMIRLGGTLLAGNIEIHINSSDWYRHGHHNDRAYDNVILHLVMNPDAEVRRSTGEIIPAAVISFDSRLQLKYGDLIMSESWVACRPFIDMVDPVVACKWLDDIAMARLHEKANLVRESWYFNDRDWEETFYQQLARNFGFRINGPTFEMVARSLPYKYLLRHRDNLFQIEAMLFGQAGMLGHKADRYLTQLGKEYAFLRRKYNLKPVEEHLWRFLRLRPANFPTVRLAQFASFIHGKSSLFSSVLDCTEIRSLHELFMVSASGYWETHFLFNKPSTRQRKNLGLFAIRSLIINTVVPTLFFYGRQRQITGYSRRAVCFLSELPPENNSVIRKWRELGIRAENAFQSQALIHLKNEFCSYKRCLNCDIGSRVVSEA